MICQLKFPLKTNFFKTSFQHYQQSTIKAVTKQTFEKKMHLRSLSKFRHLSTTSCKLDKKIRIGCASGFWGDTPTSVPQLLHGGNLDYLMFDYLSEVTMSIMTASKSKNPDLGYAPDFVLYALGPHLKQIKERNVKVIANAGGINTLACVAALKEACKKTGVDLKIAAVTGDDMMPLRKELLNKENPFQVKEMSSGKSLPKTVHSMTAYFGAGPIAVALSQGADIVVTGRTADSALALGKKSILLLYTPCLGYFSGLIMIFSRLYGHFSDRKIFSVLWHP